MPHAWCQAPVSRSTSRRSCQTAGARRHTDHADAGERHRFHHIACYRSGGTFPIRRNPPNRATPHRQREHASATDASPGDTSPDDARDRAATNTLSPATPTFTPVMHLHTSATGRSDITARLPRSSAVPVRRHLRTLYSGATHPSSPAWPAQQACAASLSPRPTRDRDNGCHRTHLSQRCYRGAIFITRASMFHRFQGAGSDVSGV